MKIDPSNCLMRSVGTFFIPVLVQKSLLTKKERLDTIWKNRQRIIENIRSTADDEKADAPAIEAKFPNYIAGKRKAADWLAQVKDKARLNRLNEKQIKLYASYDY